MNKIDIKKLEDITREIIETLEEEIPDDNSGLLCAKNHKSPFRQLIGLLEMEMASIKIMYSDEPLPERETDEFPAQKLAKSEQLAKSPVISTPEKLGEKRTHRPVSGELRQPATSDEEPETTTHRHNKRQPVSQQAATVPGTNDQHEKSQNTGSPTTKILLAGAGLLLLLLVGHSLLKPKQQAAQPVKIVVNWSDIEQGKTHADHFKEKVDPKEKKSAKSFYVMGKKELNNNSLNAAREYFRTAVSLDPSTQEYMDAFRQTDYILRRNKERRRP